jgi:hypothetical protein
VVVIGRVVVKVSSGKNYLNQLFTVARRAIRCAERSVGTSPTNSIILYPAKLALVLGASESDIFAYLLPICGVSGLIFYWHFRYYCNNFYMLHEL